jgi:hypothetical protein
LKGGALDVDLPGNRHVPVQRPEVLLLQVEALPSLIIDHGAVRVEDPNGVGDPIHACPPGRKRSTG